jgi:hypothetical protein
VLKAWDADPNGPPDTMGAKIKAVVLNCLCTKHPDTGHATLGMTKKTEEVDEVVNASTAYAASLAVTAVMAVTIVMWMRLQLHFSTNTKNPPQRLQNQ